MFNVIIVITDYNGNQRQLNLNIRFNYNNGYYMCINGDFEQLLDMRYDSDFNINLAEVYIAKWAYSFWSGLNGSWDIISLKIDKVE